MPSDSVLSLTEVRKVYGRRVHALAGVTLGFQRGTFTAVMGPSGSGKSTFLHCAAGLDRPTSGSVVLDGQEITGMKERALTVLRRERIGFVFQAFNLVPTLTVLQNVTLPLRLAGRRPDKRAVNQVIERLGLGARKGHRPAELSGGQQQRVAIARALVANPAVIFGDEPTGALDTTTAREILALLQETVRVGGQTAIIVTHDPMAAAYADRVVFLAEGLVVGELTQPTVESVAQRMAHVGALARVAS
jgi:putative ABC transport system ATP-binding protein